MSNAQPEPVDSDIQGTREINKRVVQGALAAGTRVLDLHRILADGDLVVTHGTVLGSAGPQAVAFDLWQLEAGAIIGRPGNQEPWVGHGERPQPGRRSDNAQPAGRRRRTRNRLRESRHRARRARLGRGSARTAAGLGSARTLAAARLPDRVRGGARTRGARASRLGPPVVA
jgi:hypothetical protein